MPKIIANPWLPFRGFTAMNLFGIILVRKGEKLTPVLLNHERIHTRQQLELFLVGFYVWYVVEWLYHYCKLRNSAKAYRAITFEREAYQHERDLNYLQHRPWFAWDRRYE